ncbi:hypothetical protein KC19_2G042500 [Ceratodon purpureus]|uniref:Uncharacterized protein n=1 Tax=Ceratodon purpureus TaxID=3225 RepID=A0A8T0IS41_CERPU|nr:hypothetical protein KC19_2G042500 [Ceratodon purpureus]
MLTEAAQEEIRRMTTENVELQRRICTLQKKRRSINAEQFVLEGQEAYYRARLRIWTEKKLEFKRMKDQYDTKIDTLRDKLQEKQNESNARHEGMIHYFWKSRRQPETQRIWSPDKEYHDIHSKR